MLPLGTASGTARFSSPQEVVFARQPIFDRAMGLVGFELLYRPIGSDGRPVDPERATATVLAAALGEIGLGTVVGSHRAFVNVTREFLLELRPLPVAPEHVVLELVEDQAIDGALLSALRDLVSDGFMLALDDFVYRPGLEPLLELASFAKLDVRALPPDAMADHVARLRGRYGHLTLVAEKVETAAEFAACRDLEFDAFQGFFFARPGLIRRQRTPTFSFRTLGGLMATGEDAFEELEALITHDVGLSHKLLRLVNAAHVGARSRIRSVRHALTLLGARTVGRWATMLLLADGHGQFHELLLTALVRARHCELIAAEARGADADRAFTAGLFSVADSLLGQPLPELVAALPFDDRLAAALLDHTGPEGRILERVVAYERGYFDAAAKEDESLAAIGGHYSDALEWAYDVTLALR